MCLSIQWISKNVLLVYNSVTFLKRDKKAGQNERIIKKQCVHCGDTQPVVLAESGQKQDRKQDKSNHPKRYFQNPTVLIRVYTLYYLRFDQNNISMIF